MSSNDAEFDRHVEEQETELRRRNKAARLRNMAIVILAILMTLFGAVCLFLAMDNARLATANKIYGQTQQQEKKNLAEEFDAACQSPDFPETQAGANICQKAQQVAAEPGEALAGPQGIQGVQGPRGEQGFQGPAGPKGDRGDTGPSGLTGPGGPLGPLGPSGMTGPAGPPGAASTVPGPMGPMGPAGPAGPQGEQGPAGADGADGTDGTDGATGPQGDTGRGIQSANCGDDGRWMITYTDGATQDGGTCRTTIGVGP